MSYLKTIQKNRAGAHKKDQVVHVGGIDLLIVSPAHGDPEPLHQILRKSQVSSDAARVYLKFTKDTKMPGEFSGWAWSFDRDHKWHQIDNNGIVRCPKTLALPKACAVP